MTSEKIFGVVFYIQTARLTTFSSLIALEHKFLKISSLFRIRKNQDFGKVSETRPKKLHLPQILKTGKNGWCPILACSLKNLN